MNRSEPALAGLFDHEDEIAPAGRRRQAPDWGGDDLFTSMPRRRRAFDRGARAADADADFDVAHADADFDVAHADADADFDVAHADADADADFDVAHADAGIEHLDWTLRQRTGTDARFE